MMCALESGGLDADDATLAEQSSQCLAYRACGSICPAGVQYGASLGDWRVHQWRRRRPLVLRPLLCVVGRAWGLRTLRRVRHHARRRIPADGGPNLMLGWAEQALRPDFTPAVRANPDTPVGQGCCGALYAHNGQLECGRHLDRELGETLLGVTVTTSGGCAAHLSSVLGVARMREYSQGVVGNYILGLEALAPAPSMADR